MHGAGWKVLALVAGLFVSGCSGDDGDSIPAPSSTAPAVATAAPDTTTPTTTAPAERVVLQPDGLGVVSFGASMEETLAALQRSFGEPDDTGSGCPLAGPDATIRRWEELSVQFVGGRFDAYTVRPAEGVAPALYLETADHVRLGSTVAQLEAAYGPRVQIPGLPPEHFGGNDFSVSFPDTDRRLLGTLTATADDGQVAGFFTQVCE